MADAGRTAGGSIASRPPLIIVAGPTASGKSALALELAARHEGVILNADAMQCYAELRILTARPAPEDEARAPHLLYGVLPAATRGNAGWWRKAALAALERVREAGKTPILCGGTGMYLHALLHGIAELPDPGPKAREEARALLARLGPHGLHARLAELDPETAAGLRPSDSQRLARAYEVWLGTGRGLKSWQSEPAEQLTGWSPRMILLDPPRAALRTAALARFAAMLKAGGLEEVRHLLAQDLDPALPILRAHGVPELAAHLRGQISLAEASHRAALATHQYAKRQATWFRHQKLVDRAAMRVIAARYGQDAQFSESEMACLSKFIQDVVDAQTG